MKRLILLFCVLMFSAGCAHYPGDTVYTGSPTDESFSIVPPSTLQTVSSSALQSVLSHKAESGTVTDDELVIYTAAHIQSPEDDPLDLSVREICIKDSILLVRFDVCPGTAEIFLDPRGNSEAIWSYRRFVKDLSVSLSDACIDMGRNDLYGAVVLMSDENPKLPLIWACEGGIQYDASIDNPSEGVTAP